MTQKKHYKIGILVDQLTAGGVQKIAIEDAKALTKMGHQVEIIALMRKGYNPKFTSFTKGVKIRFFSDSYPPIFKNSYKFPIFSFFSTLHILSPFLAPLIVKEKEYDIIVSHGTTTCFTAQALKARKHIPYLAMVHDPMNYILEKSYSKSLLKITFPVLKPVLRYLEKKIISQSKNVVLLSNLHKKFIFRTYHVEADVLPAGTRVPNKLKSYQRNTILASTRWEIKKNPYLLLKIAQYIPDAQINIAGSWLNNQTYSDFLSEIKTLGLSKRIHLYPDISEEKLQDLYQKARVFIHPIKEAFGMGGLEAAANGCPIIVPRGSGITQHLQNGVDGIFLNNPTEKMFIETTQNLWSNPKLAQKLGLSARSKVTDFDWKHHATKLLKIINKSGMGKQTVIVALETGHASESYLSGGDKILEKMARFFPRNIKLKIIVPIIGIDHWQKARIKNIELIPLPQTIFDNNSKPSIIFLAYVLRIWHTFWTLRKIEKADIYYSSTNVLPDIFPMFLFKLIKPKILWITRIHHLVSPPNKRPGRLFVNIVSFLMQIMANHMIKAKSTIVIALNSKLETKLIKDGFKKTNLYTLGAGIDTQEINQAKRLVRSFDGIFVGRLHPTKGIYDLVEIWQLVVKKHPKAQAIIVGGGTQEEILKLKKQMRKAAIDKNIFLSGYLTQKKLYSTLKSSKIFMFTDHEAGWGLAIGEAMAAGLPVVGYNLDVFGDVFKKGYRTVPVGDKEKFAKTIINLLENKQNYLILKKEAEQQAQKLSWQKTSEQFQKILSGFNKLNHFGE